MRLCLKSESVLYYSAHSKVEHHRRRLCAGFVNGARGRSIGIGDRVECDPYRISGLIGCMRYG